VSRAPHARLFLPLLLASAVAAACNRPTRERTFAPAPGPATHVVTVETPAQLTSVPLLAGSQDLRVACGTCHFLRPDAPLPANPARLTQFHVGLVVQHGELACASCHVEGKGTDLHLATGERLPMTEAMTLCGQCHGPQLRDYRKGAHGGMSGHWDLSRGPRTRKHCVDCHDPHSPAYVGGQPVFPPRDRGPGEDS
jgi:hypothetical protein